MKIRNKKIKIIAIITILVITILYGIWKENKGKIKIEYINEQAEITDIEDNEKTKNLHNTTMKNNENIKNKETNKTDKTDKNKIVIYIIGEVKQEGVYELDENSRISDAIEKAGGTKENADLSQINLAYKIEDGMRIYIPKKGELVQDKEKIEDKTQEVVTGKSTDITNTTSVNTNLSTNKKSKTDIEKINLNGTVKEGSTNEILRDYIGHIEETAKYDGNVGLAAHNRGNKYSYFARINELEPGDEIVYTTKYGERKYIVDTKKEILETDWSNLEGTSDNRLTLITCIKNKVNQRLCVQAVQEKI